MFSKYQSQENFQKTDNIKQYMGCHVVKLSNPQAESLADSVTKSQINHTKYGQDSVNIDHQNVKSSQQMDLLLKNKLIMIDTGLVNLEGFSQKIKQSGFQRKQLLYGPLQQIF